MTEAQIKHMVSRFLSWKLPENFHPDGGVEFDAEAAIKRDPRNLKYEPYGTNLLDAVQAEAMVRHLLDGLPAAEPKPRVEGKEYPQYAYTGPTPAKGFVGYLNIQETDTGVRFTVRSEGEEPVTAAYEVPIGDAIYLLDAALTDYAERE